ncbi:P-loop containing nucleoside triphosphate hydrolase protein [Hypoxylon rubiginosum]|uniref:P-loop containing nucleoside triphosphate hydrolase protein n=1 Tax=Hypoxylon rubiginosum TaxID=110542 RepID=A0ACC0D3I6_9PEZI|nr:P-loop containing nucleoside triphosphate hydrolase protein [Hypoxylon rubiginosum]
MSELPISTPKFYGRYIEFEEISAILNPSKLGKKRIVLFGIGGSGKTQLALQYVEKKKQLYKAVIWINAFTPEQATQSFTDAFHLVSRSWPAKDIPTPYTGNDKREFVLSRLRSTSYRNWLLVVDSVDDMESQNLVQLIPLSNHGSVIVTSTRQHASDILAPYGFQSMEIDKLDDQSGKELLLDKAELSSSFKGYDYARIITKELNGLPLALEQAGILLRKKVVNLETFVEEYRIHYNALVGYLPKAGEVQHDKTRSMHAILNMLHAYVEHESPTASAIIRLLAIVGPSQVPISVLLDVAKFSFPELLDDSEFRSLQESSRAHTIFRLHLTLLEDVCLVKIRPASDKSPESVLLHRAIFSTWTRNY